MDTAHEYDVEVSWKSGRKGVLGSPDLDDAFDVATPPQFPKGIERVWSPEHLFTAAVNSCLMTTFLAIADNSKLEFEDFTSKASGKLDVLDGKYQMSEVILKPRLTISAEDHREKALRVLHKAEAACLISNSIKSRIVFEPEIIIRTYETQVI